MPPSYRGKTETPLKKAILPAVASVLEKWVPASARQAGGLAATPAPQQGDDFGCAITKLLLAKDINEKSLDGALSNLAGKSIWQGASFVDTPRDLLQVAANLGIEIERTHHFCYPRDGALHLPNGGVGVPRTSPWLEEAVARTRSSALYFGRSATSATSNQLFNVWSGFTQRQGLVAQDLALFKQVRSLSDTYVEGGNYFAVTSSKGVLQLFIGQDHFFHTLLMLELEGRFQGDPASLYFPGSTAPFAATLAKHLAAMTPGEVALHLEEMFSLGLFEQNGRSGQIPQQDQLNLLLLRFFAEGARHTETSFRQMAQAAGLIAPFSLPVGGHAMERERAALYAAKKEVAVSIMAADLGVARENLHFIPQAGYHLDCFLTPAPANAFFITSYALLAELLDVIAADWHSIQGRLKALGGELLSEEDGLLFEIYRQTAHKLDRELSPLLNSAVDCLKAAGKRVCPLPQHIVYESPTLYREFPLPTTTPTVYFGNALTGFSSATHSLYYIAHGLTAGTQIGPLMMHLFSLALAAYHPEIDLYFIGQQKDGGQFAEAADCWSRTDTQSGIHCTTFPLQQ